MCPAPVRPSRKPAAAEAAEQSTATPEKTKKKAVVKQARAVAPKDGFQAVQAGPYARLAALGRYDSYVTTASGVDVYVRIRPGRNADTRPPLVFLDGLNGAAGRSKNLDELVDRDGVTLVSIALIGQGETLNRDLELTGGQSVRADIDPNAQAKLVLETLDQLGVKGPVDLAGLSYGGGIAAMVKHLAPDRVNRLMLAAPYTVTAMAHDPVRAAAGQLLNNNPWNPFGPVIYRATVQMTTAMTVMPPQAIKTIEQHLAFKDAVHRLTMGMEGFKLGDQLKGLSDVHVLTVPLDMAVPTGIAKAEYEKAASGSFNEASLWDVFAHDLIDQRPKTLVDWLSNVLEGKITAKPVAG